MKIKCPICGYIFDPEEENHIWTEHDDRAIHGALEAILLKTHEQIEKLEEIDKHDWYLSSKYRVDEKIELLKSILENKK